MMGCEKRTADAEFSDQIFCHNAVQWSEDNRVSVCSEKGIIIMEMKHSPLQLDKKFHYNLSQIPNPKESNNATRLPLDVFRSWKTKSSNFTEDELQELFLDHPLHPYLSGQVVNLGYVRAKWSPKGADLMGRCALAAITGNHSLSIYVTGNDRKKFKQVFDLNSILFKRYEDRVSKNMTFTEFKDVSYNMFAVDAAWSPLCNYEDVSYFLMAVAMKNGVIQLCKVHVPLCSEENVSIVSEVHPLCSIPSSVCWSPEPCNGKGYIAVGYQTGQVMNLIVDYRRMAVDSVAGLHDEQDLIQVGSSAWKVMSKGMMLLLVTKEIHVLSFLIDSKTAAVLKKNLHIGQHNFSVTGLISIGDLFVMSSEDGQLQTLQATFSENDGHVEIGFSPLSTDFHEVRKIFGISCSPNGTYVIVATWPLKKFDWKFMKRRPMHVYTLPLKPDAETRKSAEKLLLDETVPMKHIPDVLEYFRQCLWSGVNIIPSLTNFVTQTHKWFSMNVKLLRVLRYFILTIQLHIPETTDEGINEAALAKGTVSELSVIIMLKYLEKVFDTLLRSQQQKFTQTEVKILSTMLRWLEGKEEKCPSLKSEQVQQLLKNREYSDCPICHSSLKEEELTSFCPNGHTFGICCLTFLPCSTTYRTCINCNSLALPLENIKGISFLADEECSLCGGMLF